MTTKDQSQVGNMKIANLATYFNVFPSRNHIIEFTTRMLSLFLMELKTILSMSYSRVNSCPRKYLTLSVFQMKWQPT